MFQSTIQDILALAETAGRPTDVLETLGARIRAFETFENAEIVAGAAGSIRRFVIAPGLEEAAPALLAILGGEKAIRIDTVPGWKTRGLAPVAGRTSLLAVRLEAPGAPVAALVLGHSRAWSFAGAPLVRLRAIGDVALRLLLGPATAGVAAAHGDEARLLAEVARLRAHIATLEGEIAGLGGGAAKRRSGKPQ
jgi:hypothetical protein